jgi:WD40 repeat protein
VEVTRDGLRILSSSLDRTVRVWNAITGEGLETGVGKMDLEALAAGPEAYRWWASRRDMKLVIGDAATSQELAYLAATPNYVVTHPNGRLWAAAAGNHLMLFALEGKSASA